MKDSNVLQLIKDQEEKQSLSDFELACEHILNSIPAQEILELRSGDTLYLEGAYDRSIYYLKSGELKQTGRTGRIERVQENTFFGLDVYPKGGLRYTSVHALEASTLLRFQCGDVKKHLAKDRLGETTFREKCSREKYNILLKRSEHFSTLDTTVIHELIATPELHMFKRGDIMEFAGHDNLFVLAGQIGIKWKTGSGERHTFIEENDFWWKDLYEIDEAVLTGLTEGVILKVPPQQVRALFYKKLKFKKSIQLRAASLKNKIERVSSDLAESKKSLFLIKHGLTYAGAPPIIDLSKCIRCRECEQGCERRHGTSRIDIDTAPKLGIFAFPSACYRCDMPACIYVCKKGGIHRTENGEIVIDLDLCTGCSACATTCPNNAIKLIPDNNRNSIEGKKQPPVIASKCDRCHGYPDQICVRECPTGALSHDIPMEFLTRSPFFKNE